jgi:hypothetical protein
MFWCWLPDSFSTDGGGTESILLFLARVEESVVGGCHPEAHFNIKTTINRMAGIVHLLIT